MVLDYIKKTGSAVREISRGGKPAGFEELESTKRIVSHGESRSIPIAGVIPNPNQPRCDMDEQGLSELAQSISEYGLMQPITVRQISPLQYELIAGERRLQACKSLGMPYISAIIINADETDSAILALVENIQRENLSYIEEAEAFSQLIMQHGLTQEQLAAKLGKSQSAIANKIRILKLSPAIRKMLSENDLTERHARALLRIEGEENRQRVLKMIIDRSLNVAGTDALIDKILSGEEKPSGIVEEGSKKRTFKDIRIFNNTIKQAVDMMRRSGLAAKANKKENDDFIQYTIIIPKNK